MKKIEISLLANNEPYLIGDLVIYMLYNILLVKQKQLENDRCSSSFLLVVVIVEGLLMLVYIKPGCFLKYNTNRVYC